MLYRASTFTMLAEQEFKKRKKLNDLLLTNIDEPEVVLVNKPEHRSQLAFTESFLKNYKEIIDKNMDTLNNSIKQDKHELLKNYLKRLKQRQSELIFPNLNERTQENYVDRGNLKHSKTFSFVHRHFDVKSHKKRHENTNDSIGDLNNESSYQVKFRINHPDLNSGDTRANTNEEKAKLRKQNGNLFRTFSDKSNHRKSYKSFILPTQKLQTLVENDFKDDSKSSLALSPRPLSTNRNEFIDFKNILISKQNNAYQSKKIEDPVFTKVSSTESIDLNNHSKLDSRMNSSSMSFKQLPKLSRKKPILNKVQSTQIVPPSMIDTVVLNSAKYSESETSIYDTNRSADVYRKLPRTNSSSFRANLQLKKPIINSKIKLFA